MLGGRPISVAVVVVEEGRVPLGGQGISSHFFFFSRSVNASSSTSGMGKNGHRLVWIIEGVGRVDDGRGRLAEVESSASARRGTTRPA